MTRANETATSDTDTNREVVVTKGNSNLSESLSYPVYPEQYYMDGNGNLGLIPQKDDRVPLYILGLYPWEGMWHGGEAFRIATQLGFESVNANQDLLPGYTLNLIWNDTKVSQINAP